MIPARFQRTPEAVRTFGEALDRLAPYLLRSDPLADEAAAAISAWAPPAEAMKQIDRAIRLGAAPGAPEPVRALVEHARRVPVWVDWGTIERGGAAFLRAGALGGMVLGAGALPLSYTSPGGNKPLVFSGRLQEQAPRRLAETARFVQTVTQPGGLRVGGEGHAIAVKVRLMHAGVRLLLRQSGRFRIDLWGEPINQHDMLGTLLLFSVVVIEGLAQLGYRTPAADAEALLQLWRYAGHLMGVEGDLLPGSLSEARRYAEMIQATQGPPDDDSRALVRALLFSPVASARTEKQRRFAERRVTVGAALMRHFLGEELADRLEIPRSPARHLIPAVRAVVAATRPALDLSVLQGWAFRVGNRYWDAAIAAGLRGKAAEYLPPERLAGSSV